MSPTKAENSSSSMARFSVGKLRAQAGQSRIIGGSLIMLIGSALVSLVNFGYNVIVARLLGPAGFGHAAAVVTILMLLSAITLAFQLVCAKFVARNETDRSRAAVYTTLRRQAWIVGILLGGVLVLASGVIARYLNLPSPDLVVVLAAGITFYIPLGVKRGGLQGICAFTDLTTNFILEVVVKFVGAIVLIQLGTGVFGAVAAISASVILAYFLPLNPPELEDRPEMVLPPSFGEGMQAIVFFLGQVVINNIDILLVKHYFQPRPAGIYAAIALVGRVVYMLSWSVVSAMFPISAGAKRDDEGEAVILVPLLIVLGIVCAAILGLGIFPDLALRLIFGASFDAASVGLNNLLALYAAATGAYSLAVVLMAYEMSRKIANTGWIQLIFSAGIVLGIGAFHRTLLQVVVVQLVLMIALLIACTLPFLKRGESTSADVDLLESSREASTSGAISSTIDETIAKRALVRLRPVSEDEIIAEFLKSEYYHPEFHSDRDKFHRIVTKADRTNPAENALRRTLLFRRRGSMWRELPADTEWWEVALASQHLDKIHVFPRAQWRRFASDSFLLQDVVARIRHDGPRMGARTQEFLSRINALSQRLKDYPDHSGILLIGIDEDQPLTIIEGNHRMTAAMLAGPDIATQRFRFFCGFSPRMSECCWYQTTLPNLWRYARHRLVRIIYDREADLAVLRHHQDPKVAEFCSDLLSPTKGTESKSKAA
jgi:O-antigen/teichoic acid export membrane protein